MQINMKCLCWNNESKSSTGRQHLANFLVKLYKSKHFPVKPNTIKQSTLCFCCCSTCFIITEVTCFAGGLDSTCITTQIPFSHFSRKQATSSVSYQLKQKSLTLSDRWQIPAKTQGLNDGGGASTEPKSIYKCNLTVTLHNPEELLDIQPASAQINKSNPVSTLKGPLMMCGAVCTALWPLATQGSYKGSWPSLYNG